MPSEMETITDQFNRMMGQMNKLVEEVKMVSARQKDAEITALEAQINPHFLYNTLDTINWMAINADQYEISSAIGALARILRYGIDKSNSIVTLREEMEWLQQYIFLQQTRLKNTFSYEPVSYTHLDVYKRQVYMPSIISPLIMGYLWTLILSPSTGVLDKSLEQLGVNGSFDWICLLYTSTNPPFPRCR